MLVHFLVSCELQVWREAQNPFCNCSVMNQLVFRCGSWHQHVLVAAGWFPTSTTGRAMGLRGSWFLHEAL